MIFLNPYQELFVPKHNQALTTALSRHKTVTQEYFEVARDSFTNLE